MSGDTDRAVEAGLREKAAVMEGWAAPPDLQPASRWLSLSVALAILRGTHPALTSYRPVAPDSPDTEADRLTADRLLDAVEDAIQTNVLPANAHRRLSDAYNAIVARAALSDSPDDTGLDVACGYRCHFTREQHETNERIRHPFYPPEPTE